MATRPEQHFVVTHLGKPVASFGQEEDANLFVLLNHPKNECEVAPVIYFAYAEYLTVGKDRLNEAIQRHNPGEHYA